MLKPILSRLLLAFLLFSTTLSALGGTRATKTPPTVSSKVAHAMGCLYVCYNGRVCPLATMAFELTQKCYGQGSFMGLTPEQVLAGWLFYYDDWARPGSASMEPIAGNDEKLTIVTSLSAGETLLIYPVWEASDDESLRASQRQLHWYSTADRLPAELSLEEWTFIRKSLNLCAQYLYEGQEAEALHLLERMRAYQVSRAGEESLPSPLRFEAELLYLHLPSMRVPAILCLLLGLMGYVVWMIHLSTKTPSEANRESPAVSTQVCGGRRQRACGRIAPICAACVVAYLTFFLALRWLVSGHIPLATGFETMTFLAWIAAVGGVAAGVVATCHTDRLAMPSLCLLICGLSLLVASMGMSNPQITPLAPVLASPLLCLHVVVIMIAYALLAVICLNGIAALLLPSHAANALRHSSRRLLAPALALLSGGIFVGAIWANRSWGTYWSWDPKETWALVTMFVYSFPLHDASMPRFRRPRFFHAYMALAFIAVLITYFGVNFLLGGMHSYGR